MPSTTSYNRADVVLASFPFTDLTSTKRRPALVISPNSFNYLNHDLILAAITSQVSLAPYSIHVAPSECENGSIPKESIIKLTKVFTISSALVLKTLYALNEKKVTEVLTALRDLNS